MGEVANDIVDTRVCVLGVLIEVAGRGGSGDMLYYRAQSGYKERTNFMRRRENLSPVAMHGHFALAIFSLRFCLYWFEEFKAEKDSYWLKFMDSKFYSTCIRT